ncbi:hypothetical protein ASPZODRAFT_74813 [Penicilliopsis zonata CBS 506.65]|uniref:DWNN domain-containing protein n=1 Tax=Penicilliopsis zonata CBS 506.65 TaxID=1073090 RepID=A0A1L9S817_9EURO|nr:hypothetical protein ASPZODRAFT_74813 [Penicilliopsis zonata CBS 506.65]OJJ43319.1 hypothetical protein ASPZODRAFT_74813 [Penicilliopsis zonata CBS 506.65]
MSSSVHFKFKSQKEPSRVTFDGTGISVFELKREIINQSRLGDGTDVELSIYNEDTKEEYDDDTAIIPRSTSVIARRLPASRPGKGGAARYVSGKMPVNPRNASRIEQSTSSQPILKSNNILSASVSELNNAQTEDEKINALFNLQANQWKEQQQEMANATPILSGRGRGKPVNVPDHPPPPGYLCYRCREKGHWIQACPTNNDPKFDGRYRVKRSTGIPRSLQTKVEKSELPIQDGSTEDLKNTGIMVNADGDFVIAKPDKASWELYQEKVKASAAAAAEAAITENNRELHTRGLLCPIDKRLYLEPTKTPCCQQTYCNDCITNALIESDFVCPNCETEGVLLDNLSPDDEVISKIKLYETEKQDKKKEKEKSVLNQDTEGGSQPPNNDSEGNIKIDNASLNSIDQSAPAQSNKRPADEYESRTSKTGDETATPPMKKIKSEDKDKPAINTESQNNHQMSGFQSSQFNLPGPFGTPGFMQFQGMGMPFPDPSFMNEGMGSLNPMAFPASGPFPPNMDPAWHQMNALNFPTAGGNFNGNVNNEIMAAYGPSSMYNTNELQTLPMGYIPNMQQNTGFQQGPGMNNFSNQQRTAFSTPYNREEDTPYFRQPVNPQRHQARHRRVRPSDYREL